VFGRFLRKAILINCLPERLDEDPASNLKGKSFWETDRREFTCLTSAKTVGLSHDWKMLFEKNIKYLARRSN
jgi:hypothetical protein